MELRERRTRRPFSTAETEAILTLSMRGFKPYYISKFLEKQLSSKRTPVQVSSKLMQLRLKGITGLSDFKKPGIVTTEYEVPQNSMQAISQIDLAITLFSNVRKYLASLQEKEIEEFKSMERIRKIKGMLEDEPN